MNQERLMQLARVVAAAPEHRFHMHRFRQVTKDCGTAYCAAGWAAMDPWFASNGFPELWDENFETRDGTDEALADYFGITISAANILFALDSSWFQDPHAIAKGEVLANIHRLLIGEEVKLYAVFTEDSE